MLLIFCCFAVLLLVRAICLTLYPASRSLFLFKITRDTLPCSLQKASHTAYRNSVGLVATPMSILLCTYFESEIQAVSSIVYSPITSSLTPVSAISISILFHPRFRFTHAPSLAHFSAVPICILNHSCFGRTNLQGAANQLALAANPNIGMSPHKIFMVYYDPDIDGLDYDGFSQVQTLFPCLSTFCCTLRIIHKHVHAQAPGRMFRVFLLQG
jgi:hypothetical protein